MTAASLIVSRSNVWPVPGWIVAAGVLATSAIVGSAFGGVARPVFIFGCAAAGWHAWRQGPAAHLQAVLVLFAFAPFVRRIVDLSAGFDQAGLMLVGPLLAILAPAPQAANILTSSRSAAAIVPILVVGGCVVYAAALSMLQADWMNAASGALKWVAPLVYAAALIDRADRGEMVDAATSAFTMILPIIGIYGIVQYVQPPAWDVYWMQFASILSAGQPVPYGVRTFSTMNGPASFATFTAIGLLFVCFSRLNRVSLLLVCPAAFALLLSLYRTAWISLAVGILFCMLFSPTRRRAGIILIGIVAVVVLAAMLTPFGDVIGDRIATLGEGAQDGSAQERLDQFVTLWTQWDSSLIGVGFTNTDVGTAGAMPVDGMLIACWLTMGIVVGLVCLAALISAIVLTLWTAWRDGNREAIIIGALGFGALVQMPLANITSGESGFLFWTFAVLLSSRPSAGLREGRAIRA